MGCRTVLRVIFSDLSFRARGKDDWLDSVPVSFSQVAWVPHCAPHFRRSARIARQRWHRNPSVTMKVGVSRW